MNFIRRYLVRRGSARHLNALDAFPLFADDERATSEAEYWKDVCEARKSDLPLPRDPVSRSILAMAAKDTQRAGFASIVWCFRDDSKLTANDTGVWVR